jgi:glycosyltransferase involved in cell wall biosynthesis
MNVSIVVPAYNSQKTICAVLDALLSQEYEEGQIEILVIDDCSKDNTRELMNKYSVSTIFNRENIGLANSLNKGISLSKHEIIVTLHADTIPATATWLKELVSPLKNPKIAATCSLQMPPQKSQRSLTAIEEMLWGKLGPHNALNDKADAYRRSALEEVGLFDGKTFRTAGEDEDMALRLRMYKKVVKGTPAKVVHDHYFDCQSNTCILKKILRKEFSFGRASGALRRKFPLHKPGSYVFPNPKPFTNDGLFRVIVCLGCFFPFAQLVFIPILVIASLVGISTVFRRSKKLLLFYPFFNIFRFFTFTPGYVCGIITGRQV